MADLSTKSRKALPASKFGLPRERKYPLSDRAHAANAKARASQEEKRGKLSRGQEAEVDKKADRVLGKKKKDK